MIAHHGLTEHEVFSQRKKFGLNEVAEQSQSNIVYDFLRGLRSQSNLLLAVAGTAALTLGEYLEGAIIVASIFLNTGIEVFQSYKANKAVDALKKLTTFDVRIIRDGAEGIIPSQELVPGDIVYLEEGSRIPADGVYLQGNELEADESLLTGESLRIAKQKDDLLMSGTYIGTGNGYMRVTAIGHASTLGKIIERVDSVQTPETPLEKLLLKLTSRLSIAGLVMSIIVCILLVANGSKLANALVISLAFAVSFIPSSLPLVLTVILSYGVKQLAGHKAIAKSISVIEALGSIDTVVTDKTGTITSNQMAVSDLYLPHQSVKALHLSCLIVDLCNHTTLLNSTSARNEKVVGDSTEGALLKYSQSHGHEPSKVLEEWVMHGEIPFSSLHKYMAVLCSHRDYPHKRFSYLKGAPEVVLHMCAHVMIGDAIHRLSDKHRETYTSIVDTYAQKGKRVIAIAYALAHTHESTAIPTNGYIFVGYFAIMDPLQPHIPEVVEASKLMGITTYMATGDHPQMALHIARLAGIASEKDAAITGVELNELTDQQLVRALEYTKVFARVKPEDKQRVTKALQSTQRFVALTGDGVNDTIALKQANVGIAMGMKGSDAAKEVAQIVLVDDNFGTLIDALHAGRAIIQKLKRAIMFLISTNCMEAGVLLFGVIAGLFGLITLEHESLLTPLQLLYINFVTDSVPAFAFAFMPIARLPRESSKKHSLEDFFSLHTLITIGSTALLGIVISLAAYFYMRSVNPHYAQSFLFDTLVAIQIWVFADEWVSQGRHKITPFFLSVVIGMFAFHYLTMMYFGGSHGDMSTSQVFTQVTSANLLASLIFLSKALFRNIRGLVRSHASPAIA